MTRKDYIAAAVQPIRIWTCLPDGAQFTGHLLTGDDWGVTRCGVVHDDMNDPDFDRWFGDHDRPDAVDCITCFPGTTHPSTPKENPS